MTLYGPDRKMQAYFLLHRLLSSCRGLRLDGMPHAAGNAGAPAHLRARLADLSWHVQDLSKEELEILELRLLGFGGVGSSERYVLTPSDLEPDEVPTGQRHPDDNRFLEVRGVQVRQPSYKALSDHLDLPVKEISAAVRSARSKVARRMRRKKKEPV